MSDVLYLAWRYLRYNRGKTVVLVASISLILFLPAALRVVVRQASLALTARADATPLLLGPKGSAVDLTLASLYFREPTLEPLRYAELGRVLESGLADAIPLHMRYRAGQQRIVGTTPDYLEFRGLRLAAGRSFAILGECVLGADAAASLQAAVGGHVLSTPAGAFDVAGSFPLKLSVVGVLEPSQGPDDAAVFVDLKTAWVIDGLAHGHQDAVDEVPDSAVLRRDPGNVVANASLLSYTEITPDNIGSFHFHGDPAGFPIDAVLPLPHDRKSRLLLRGRYAETPGDIQIVVPRRVVDELVDTLFSIRDLVTAVSLGLALATLATAWLVLALSIRLRRREIETMLKIGAPRRRLRAILGAEILLVLLSSVGVATVATLAAARYGDALLQLLTG